MEDQIITGRLTNQSTADYCYQNIKKRRVAQDICIVIYNLNVL